MPGCGCWPMTCPRLRQSLQAEVADETAVRQRRGRGRAGAGRGGGRRGRAGGGAGRRRSRAAAAAQDVHFRLSALSERFQGTQKLAAQRLRHLSEFAEQERLARDPDELEREAAEVRATEQELTAELAAARQLLQDAVAQRQQDERELADAERAVLAAARAVADRREGLAKLAGQVNALRSRASAGGDEIARLAAAAGQARERAAAARAELETAHHEVGALDQGELDLDSSHEAALARHAEAAERLRELTEAHRTAERERSTWTARREALAMGLTRKDGAGALLAAGSRLPGLLGSVAALLSVEPGYEAALTAALGALADAVAVSSPAEARTALQLLKSTDAGRAGLLVGGGRQPARARRTRPALPAGARWAVEVLSCPEPLRAAVESALAGVAVVADLDAAERLVAEHAELRAVTRAGDVLGRDWAAGGSASSPSALEVQAAVDEADQRAGGGGRHLRPAGSRTRRAREVTAGLQAEVEATLAALNESDARLNAVAERLAQLAQVERSATGEAERLDLARQAAEQARDADLAGLVELEERLRLAEAEPTEQEPPVEERDARAERVAAARQAEMEARLSVRTQEERVRALAGRAEQLLRSAQAERQARAREQAARLARARGARIAAAVDAAAGRALAELDRAVLRAAEHRDAVQAARAEREAALKAARSAVRELGAELARLTDVVHRDEVARAEQRLRIEQLETRAAEEFGIEAEALLADYGSDQPVPPSAQELAEWTLAAERGEDVVSPQPGPYDRADGGEAGRPGPSASWPCWAR